MSDSTDIKVDVICPTYNHKNYIKKTLDGFVRQKVDFKFRVIVHDDASTDGTDDVIKEYAKKYPELIFPIYESENQYSKGIGITRDIIWPYVKGKYIAFCEGDDYWCDDNKLQTQYDIMESHDECSICVHDVQCIDEKGDILCEVIPDKMYQIKEGILDSGTIEDIMWKYPYGSHHPFQTSSYFMRFSAVKDYANDNLLFTKMFTGDQVFLRLAIKNGYFYRVSKIMSCYRKGSLGSWTKNYSKQSLDYQLNVLTNWADGDYYYNQYSEGKFEEKIQIRLAYKVAEISSISPFKAKSLIKKYNIKINKLLGNIDIHCMVLLFTSKYIPHIMYFIRRIYHRIVK